MKEIVIKPNEAGQRLDKLLRKYLSEAPGSFICFERKILC